MKHDQEWGDKELVYSIDSFWRESEFEYKHRITVSNVLKEDIDDSHSILDVGCGSGFFFEVLGHSKYTGLDYSNPMLSIFKKKYNAPIIQGSIYDLPFKNDSFDGVICIDVLSHLSNIDKPIRELIRVSKNMIFFTIWSTKERTRDISDELVVHVTDGDQDMVPIEKYKETTKIRYMVYNIDYLAKYYLLKLCRDNNGLVCSMKSLETFKTTKDDLTYTCFIVGMKKENYDTTK